MDESAETILREPDLATAAPWNECLKCGDEVQDDMRTGEFFDGSEGSCVGCGARHVASVPEEGEAWLNLVEDDDHG